MTCELCGSQETTIRHADVFGMGANLVECMGCGFRFYDHVVKPPAEVYANPDQAERSFKYKTQVRARQTDDNIPATEKFVHHYYNGFLDWLVEHLGSDISTLYEVGCAWGMFLEVARRRGIEVAGCDLNARKTELGREELGLDIVHGFFLDTPAPAGRDAVVMLDVLEHVWRPRAVLSKAVSLLRPGGVVLIKTFYDEHHDTFEPDLRPEAWGGDIWTCGYFDPMGHPSHFTLPVLRKLVTDCGLTICHENLEQKHGQVTIVGRLG